MFFVVSFSHLCLMFSHKERFASMKSMEEFVVHTKKEKQVLDITHEVRTFLERRGLKKESVTSFWPIL